MWSETVGLRTRPVSYQKKSVLVLLCCETGLVSLFVSTVLKDTATFEALFISLFCAWNITTVEINSDVHLLKT